MNHSVPVSNLESYATCGERDTSKVSPTSVNRSVPASDLRKSTSAAIDAYCTGRHDHSTPCTAATVQDLHNIAYRAFLTPNLPNESAHDSHLRIGTILAAERQLEDYRHEMENAENTTYQLSECLIGEIKVNPSKSTKEDDSTSDEERATQTNAEASAHTAPSEETTVPSYDYESCDEGIFSRSYTLSDAECMHGVVQLGRRTRRYARKAVAVPQEIYNKKVQRTQLVAKGNEGIAQKGQSSESKYSSTFASEVDVISGCIILNFLASTILSSSLLPCPIHRARTSKRTRCQVGPLQKALVC